MFMRAAAALVGAGLAASVAPAAMAAPATAPQLHKVPAVKDVYPHQARTAKVAGKAATNGGQLNAGQQLASGSKFVDNDATLEMQADGNLVVYLNNADGTHFKPVWSSGTYNNAGAYALMQADGNLVIYKAGRTDPAGALWSTQTSNHAGSFAVFWAGDLMIVDNSNNPAYWGSHTGYLPTGPDASGNYTDTPSDTLASDHVLTRGRWIESTTAWTLMQPDGNLVIYRKRDGQALWSTQTNGKTNDITYIGPDGVLWVADLSTNADYWDDGVYNGTAGAFAKIQGDLNFVVYLPGGTNAVWSSRTAWEY
jgi:hypothetical protein